MEQFEESIIALLTEIKNELSAIHQTMDAAMNAANETNSDLMNSIFGLLQQDEKE